MQYQRLINRLLPGLPGIQRTDHRLLNLGAGKTITRTRQRRQVIVTGV